MRIVRAYAGFFFSRSVPASARLRAGSASTSTLAPTSAKPNTVTASAMPGKTEGHHWP